MNLSDLICNQFKDRYQSILMMPLVVEWANDTLPKEHFKFYRAQDSLYLEHFGRLLALIAAGANDISQILKYLTSTETALFVENILHESYFKDFSFAKKGENQSGCHYYIQFLKSTAALDFVEIAITAVLPCFWIYKKVGDYIYNHFQSENNPYQKWIDANGGEEFADAVKQTINLCNEVASETASAVRKKLKEVFITSSRMEYHFWEAAHNLKKRTL